VRAVNLLPGGDTTGGRKPPPLPILLACIGAVLVAAVTAAMFLSASSDVSAKRRALAQVQAQYDAIPAPPTPPPGVAQLPQQQQTRLTALSAALGQRVAWDRLLREVSQVVPSDVWLVNLNALAPALAPASAAATSATQGFSVLGCTYSQDSVARFLARLQVVPDLTGMTLGKSSAGDASAGAGGGSATCPAGMFTFTLQGSVRTAGAPA
jgi:Tfp pilus assembly protein PilN